MRAIPETARAGNRVRQEILFGGVGAGIRG